jgi:Xaa-Pro aminopeptidase
MARTTKTTPPDWIDARIRGIRSAMGGAGVDAYLLTNHMDTFYATGFTGEDSAVLITRRGIHIISDGRFDEAIDDEVSWARKHLRKKMLADEIGIVCKTLKLKSLAVQADALTVSMHGVLKRVCKPTKITLAPSIVNGMRERKDAKELRVMRRAIAVAQEGFLATRGQIQIGMTEAEVAARIEYEMRLRGSTCAAFSTICAVNGNASRPHALAGSRKVKAGSIILVDWGATVGFYRSDLTRCFFVGRVPRKMGEVYKIVLEAQMAAIEAIGPGVRCCDVDAVARNLIAGAGYKEEFSHGLGHGLGLDVHESPSLSWRSSQELSPGMVVTVEPGIYLAGRFGVRIEDDVLVTDGGHRVLSDLDKSLEGAVI